jgi:hypothetical protein
MTLLLPCDVMLARNQTALNKAIRFFTRNAGEPETIAAHCGVIVGPGEDLAASVIESNAITRRRTLKEGYGSNDTELCVFRPLNLTDAEKRLILAKAETFVGKKYGVLKLGLHLADWFLDGAYVFRRLGRMDRYPICSYTVARSFQAAGKDFGVSDYAASPDDIWDFCVNNPDKYRFVWQRGSMFNPQL